MVNGASNPSVGHSYTAVTIILYRSATTSTHRHMVTFKELLRKRLRYQNPVSPGWGDRQTLSLEEVNTSVSGRGARSREMGGDHLTTHKP